MALFLGKRLPPPQIAQPTAPGEPINDATSYDVETYAAENIPGQPVWKVVRVHHLSPEENHNGHAAYLTLLDEEGQMLTGQVIRVDWGAGQEEITAKGEGPFSLVYSLTPGFVYRLWVQGAPSDEVVGIHTYHSVEKGGNKPRHHSFAVTWQRQSLSPAEKPLPQSTAAGEGSPETLGVSPREMAAEPTVQAEPLGETIPPLLAIKNPSERGDVETMPETTTPAPTAKPIPHYVLFGRPFAAGVKARLALSLDYLWHFRLSFGFNNIQAARLARQVTIIADTEALTPEKEVLLRQDGCQVERLDLPPDQLMAELQQRVEADRPFPGAE